MSDSSRAALEAAADADRSRWIEIDLLKGCAILWVLLIHSKALGDTPLYFHVVNRAVPLFVIVFGMNARLWWRGRDRQDLFAWYASRLERILVPFWAALSIWWALVVWLRPHGLELHAWLPLLHLAGIADSIGTGWFVTMILLLALLYPGIEEAVRRLGIWPVLAVTLAAELALVSVWGASEPLIRPMSELVFPPRVLGHVVFGIFLADRLERVGPRTGAASAAVWILCVATQSVVPELATHVRNLADLPLSVSLLVALRVVARAPLLAHGLAWLGRASWGIYLGQLIVHNAVVFRCGFHADLAPNLANCAFPFTGEPGASPMVARAFYTALLLAGALAFVGLGAAVLRGFRAVRAAT